MKLDPETRPRRWSLARLLLPVLGFCSLVWFLVRVLPKPSRATYPCQRAAFPLASAFVVWATSTIASMIAVRKARECLRRVRTTPRALAAAAALLAAGGLSILAALSWSDTRPTLASPPRPNEPVGVARGLHPGRVAWVHDRNATDWEGGTGAGAWWFEHTDASVAASMLSRAIRGYAGIDDEARAWDAIFRHFNVQKGKGDVGYRPGEKFAIKLNFVVCFAQPGSNRVDASYVKSDSWKDNIDPTPELVHALLDQLVHVVGVDPADIWIGDPTGLFPNYLYDLLYADFPDLHYWDNRGTLGRTRAEYSDHPLYWSKSGLGTVRQDYVPVAYAQAAYVVNFALLKSHDAGGITVCAKNHYGSLIRLPTGAYRDSAGTWHSPPSGPAYYPYHDDLPATRPETGRYRNFVDFMGHDDIGGKTILYLIDGIVAGRNWSAEPEPWTLPPFDSSGGWPCSILISMDPVAIDSVAFDFLLEQWPEHAGMSGADDYLVEAALADAPPSGTFYDPNHAGNVARLASLGVHEHWSDPIAKRYSRDIDPEAGTGIELLRVHDDRYRFAKAEATPAVDGEVDAAWTRTLWRSFPRLVDPLGGELPDDSELSGRWKALWDSSGLHLLVEVRDDTLVHSEEHDSRYWLDDNVEVFVDGDHSLGGGEAVPNYDGVNDFELGFRWGDPEVRFGSNSVERAEGIEFAMVAVEGGYRLEASLPWSLLRSGPEGLAPVGPGTRIGFDVHITDNDDVGDGDRDAKLAWHSTIDDTWRDASLFASVELGEQPAIGGILVEKGAEWRFLEGTGEVSSPIDAWREPGFDDSAWKAGPLPIGYGDGPFGTELAGMEDAYTTVFLRRTFELPGDASVTRLRLGADYDDGLLVWLNGEEVLRVNAPSGDPRHDSLAAENHESGRYESFPISEPDAVLVEGENTLAVQGFNVSLSSSDFKLDIELSFQGTRVPSSVASFVRADSNGDGFVDISDAVHVLLVLFVGLAADDCDDARDVDDDGAVNVTDVVAALEYLFRSGPPPAAPFPAAGGDPTPDGLACSR